MTELRALTRLAFAELGLGAGGIGEVHRAIADRAFSGDGLSKTLHDAISGAVYAGVRGAATLTGHAASAVVPERGVAPPALAVLNGLRGDVLEPPLAIPMTLRVEGAETPRAGRRSTSATTPAATSPRTAAPWRRSSKRSSQSGKLSRSP